MGGLNFKKVAQVVGAVGGVIGAPFTGGASLAITAASVGSMASDSAANQQKKIVNQQTDAAAKLEAQQVADAAALQQNALALNPTVTPTSVNNSPTNLAPTNDAKTINAVAQVDYTPLMIGGGAMFLALIFFLKKR